MTQGVEISRGYDPDTDCWFVTYKFTAKEFDEYQQEELEIDEGSEAAKNEPRGKPYSKRITR